MWNERTEILIGKSNVELLNSKTVAIFGLGGVGSYAVESLVRFGVGTLILIDFDVVNETNLNRQLIATQSTIGMKKTEVCLKRIQEINPECKVICKDLFVNEETIEELMSLEFDAAIDAIDVITSKLLLIENLEKKGIPFISSLGMGGRLDPTQIRIGKFYDVKGDRLASALRKAIKEREYEIHDFPVAYSLESVHKFTGFDQSGETRKERHPIGSSAFVPSVSGLACASYIIRKLIEK